MVKGGNRFDSKNGAAMSVLSSQTQNLSSCLLYCELV